MLLAFVVVGVSSCQGRNTTPEEKSDKNEPLYNSDLKPEQDDSVRIWTDQPTLTKDQLRRLLPYPSGFQPDEINPREAGAVADVFVTGSYPKGNIGFTSNQLVEKLKEREFNLDTQGLPTDSLILYTISGHGYTGTLELGNDHITYNLEDNDIR